MLARENFDRLHVWQTRRTLPQMLKKVIPTASVQRGPLFLPPFGEWPRLPSTARINDPSKLARFSSHGMAPVLVPLRPSSEGTDDPSKLARYLSGMGAD